MGIFKAYDIRGKYPGELNEAIACKIGKAIAAFLNAGDIAVGRDMRTSSDKIFNALAKGIAEQGTNVIDIGVVSAPMCYFGCYFLKTKGSVMITASHNPKEYNGFKITREKAIPVSEDTGIKEIEEIYNQNNYKQAGKKGKIIKKEIKSDYSKHILGFIDKNKINKKLKIVVDAGNGMGAEEARLVLGKLPIKMIPLFFKLDGNFPSHEPNPLKEENIRELKNRVVKEKADLGIAFDGDADRVCFVTNEGEAVPADFVIALIAGYLLKEKPNEIILYDIRSSWVAKEKIEENKGIAHICRVGHAFIKEQLRKENAMFGGELAGHFYFRDNFYTDSGIIAALKMIELISVENKKLSELIKPLKKYYATGEINFEVKDKEGKIRELARIYKDGKQNFLDGIRVDYKDWWFNVRPSNTEPLLRLNLEAKSKELMEKKRDEVLKIIRR